MRGIMAGVCVLAVLIGIVLVVVGLIELLLGDRSGGWAACGGVVLGGVGALALNVLGRGR